MIYKIFVIVILMIIFTVSVNPASGHGVGYELHGPEWLGEIQVNLAVTSSRYTYIDNPDRQIRFALKDADSGAGIRDVMYGVSAYKGDLHLFDGKFTAHNGMLVFSFKYEDADTYVGEQIEKFSPTQISDDGNKTIDVFGRDFGTGGLYKFEIKLLATEQFPDGLGQPIVYDIGISIPQRTEWQVENSISEKKRIGTVAYYDKIIDFMYEPTTKAITFSIPFEWSKENINNTLIVHEEIVFTKSFGELLVSEYDVKVNGMAIPKEMIVVDDFPELERIVHVVLNQSVLFELEESQHGKKILDTEIKPAEDAISSVVANNWQFRIDLWYESEGGDTVFYFRIKDVFLNNKLVDVPYKASVIQDEKLIRVQEGTSSDTLPDMIRASVLEKKPVLIRFENLNDNEKMYADIWAIIDTKSQNFVPNWVKQSAKWWAVGTISDGEFIDTITYLVENGIIQVPPTQYESDAIASVPHWVKQSAKWWADGTTSDGEFIDTITYLISVGIIIPAEK